MPAHNVRLGVAATIPQSSLTGGRNPVHEPTDVSHEARDNETSSFKSHESNLKVDSRSNGTQSAEPNEAAERILFEQRSSEQKQLQRMYCSAYRNLFLTFYNKTPKISSVDINQALSQSEPLVKLANVYDSLSIVGTHLEKIFAQYRHGLYVAVAKDPPRWLAVASDIRSGPIFAEALIHLVGCYPFWPWITSKDSLKANLLHIIEKKAIDLAHLRTQVNCELLVNTLKNSEDGSYVALAGAGESGESWMCVQIYRDWLAQHLNDLRETNNIHDGTIYRLLGKGGEAYLPYKDLIAKLKEIDMGDWEHDDDLQALKDFAKQAVRQLVKNNLMVDAESLGIQYLTCVEVDMDDYPWAKEANPGQ